MTRHDPSRTCVACRTRRAKAELVRIARRPDGSVVLDPGGRAEGRGAYLCASATCWSDALKRSALQRALRTKLPKELEDRLQHGDIAAARDAAAAQAPTASQGGIHGT